VAPDRGHTLRSPDLDRADDEAPLAEAARHAEDARSRFEALYERWPSWEIGRPQPAFVELATAGLIRGVVLDAGCGTGENALYLAALGLEVYGIDIAPSAIGMARARASERCCPAARFLVGDALRLETLGISFDTVIDSGLLHALDDDERRLYVESLGRVVAPGGLYHVLGFSHLEPGTSGPRRLHPRELVAALAPGWEQLAVEHARFFTRACAEGARALRGSFRRRG
jgi:SAM-dependent methyltransferase